MDNGTIQSILIEDALDHVDLLAAVCQFTARLYKFVVDEEAASRIATLDANDDQDPVMGNSECREGLRMMQESLAEHEGDLLLLSNDFHDLFVGPHSLKAAPWSSVYLDPNRSLNGPTSFMVRDVFNKNGFEIPEGTAEPADHIAYEWQFMADMQRRLVEAVQTCNDEQARVCAQTLSDFLGHLSAWLDAFTDRMKENAQTGFYRGLAQFSLGVRTLEQDALSTVNDILHIA